jgi:hypothetical protein
VVARASAAVAKASAAAGGKSATFAWNERRQALTWRRFLLGGENVTHAAI